MKLIAGLGNPGPRYADSRHNVGFRVADELARRAGVELSRYDRHFEALLGEGQLRGQRVLLLKPQTFMNLSGRSVSAAWRFYKLPLVDLLIAYDDLDLPLGRLRVRACGSAGGHKGILDVMRSVGSAEVARVRIGIGNVQRGATVEYVLSRFLPQEREQIDEAVCSAADAIESWLTQGVDAAMNRYNPKPKRPAGDRDAAGADPGPQGESS